MWSRTVSSRPPGVRGAVIAAAVVGLMGGLLLPAVPAFPASAQAPVEVPGFDVEAFVTPEEQRPAVLWFWDRTQSEADVDAKLESIHDAGFRETVIFRWASNLPEAYLSDAWFDRVGHLLEKSRELGMTVWLSNDAQFPSGSAGGFIVNGGTVGDKVYEPRPDLGVKTVRYDGAAVRDGGRRIQLHDLFGTTLRLEDGAVVADSSSAPGITLLREGAEWTDYTVTADFAIETATAGFMVRSADPRNGYLVDVRTDGGVDLWRQADGDFQLLKQSAARSGFDAAGDHQIKITLDGPQILVSLDGTAAMDASDAVHLIGGFGMRVDGPQKWALDSLQIEDADGATLFSNRFDDDSALGVWDTEARFLDDAIAVTARPASGGTATDVDAIVDLTDQYLSTDGRWDAPAGQWRLEAYSSAPRGGDRADYADVMSGEAQQLYLDIVYDEFYERFGEYFGSTFLGFADDEPEVGRHGDDIPPWSPDLGARLEADGVNVARAVSAVFQDFGADGDALRSQFYRSMSDQWVDAYWQSKYDWADAHGIGMISNPLYDEYGPAGRLHESGNLMTMHQRAQVPGTDLIADHVERGYARNLPREPASVAHQLGLPLVYDEMMGATGWHKSIADVRDGTVMSAVRGINKGLFHATFDAPETAPFPPTFSENNVWWKFVPELTEWTGRLMAFGRHTTAAQTGLVQMQRAAEMVQRGDEASVDEPFFTAQHALENAQVDFDLIDEGSLSDDPMNLSHAEVTSDGTLHVGEMAYRTVVVPTAPVMSLGAAQRLLEFVGVGGEVIFAGTPPEREVEQRDAELAKVFAQLQQTGGSRVVIEEPEAAGDTAAVFGRAAIELEDANSDVRVLRFQEKETTGYLIVNEGTSPLSTNVSFPAAGVPVEWNPDSGSVAEFAVYEIEEESTTVPMTLEPFVPVAVTISPTSRPSAHVLGVDGTGQVQSVAVTDDGELAVTLRSSRAEDTALRATDAERTFFFEHRASALPAALALDGAWSVTVPGAPAAQRELGSWTDFAPAHSGDVVYERHVTLTAAQAAADWTIDLGVVADAAMVTVNGQSLGSLTHAPFRVDAGPALAEGTNTLTVTVTNTDANIRGDHRTSGLLGPVVLRPYTVETVIAGKSDGALPELRAQSESVKPGDTQRILGSGFAPEEQFSVELRSELETLPRITSDENGGVDFSFRVPADIDEGAHDVVVFSDGIELARATFQVEAAQTGPGTGGSTDGSEDGSGSLATTGGQLSPLLSVICLLLLTGGIYVARRRRLGAMRSTQIDAVKEES